VARVRRVCAGLDSIGFLSPFGTQHVASAGAEREWRCGQQARVGVVCRVIGSAKEREMRTRRYVEELRQDLRYAARLLGRSPGFAAVAALTLALGIGATTAIFSAVHAVVLRPLPFPAPERLVRIYATSPATTSSDEASPKDFAMWRRESRSFAAMAAIETRGFTFAEGGRRAEHVTGVRTTADYFPMLGVRPLLGRFFTAQEDRPAEGRVAVLSHRFWSGRFGGDRGVLGRSFRLDAEPFTVIGVLPPSFDAFAGEVDLWTPIAFTPEQETTVETGYLDVVARLAPGVTSGAAQADVAAVMGRMADASGGRSRSARVIAFMDDYVGPYGARLWVLLGAVSLVLLIACVNVANLLLARGVRRGREVAIRAALGAGRARVIRQMLAESLVLGAAGGVAGLLVAHWTLSVLLAASPDGVPRLEQAAVNGAVLAFASALTILSSILFGLLPALRSARLEPASVLSAGGRWSSGSARDRVRRTLVATEVALTLVLLVGAGLLIRSAIATQRVDPGIDPSAVWTGRVTLPATEYVTPAQRTRTFEALVDGAGALPGVEQAAAISVPPFTGVRALGLFVPEGRPVDADNALMANLRLVTPGLFYALRLPVLAGRDFTLRDDASAPPVVIVNEPFAQLAWPNEEALGRMLYGPGANPGDPPIAREVIAVVGATHEDGLREAPRPAIYYALRQVSPLLWEGVQSSLVIVARTGADPLAITQGMRSTVAAVDRGLALSGVASLEERLAQSYAVERFNTRLLSALGAVGLLLAVVGIYGVVAYLVGQRTREIGLRMALGATRGRVVVLVLRQGFGPIAAGVLAGVVAAAGLTRVLASQLYGVRATDPATFAAVVLVVAGAAAAAAAVPARRAARIDPRRALEQ
jgi:putative ABC transport system permease protein